MSHGETTAKPIEYYINRATDPYVEESDRVHFCQQLCDKVDSELDGAQIATNVLAHKIVSPDQKEALNSLKAVDALMRKCGSKVHVKVGRFKFLNQMVKVVSPKYQGKESSAEVRDLTIMLLYSWHKSMPYIDKFKEVYETLKEHGLIDSDPALQEDDIPRIPPPPPKIAPFEDEEKSRLLKDLLKSNNPDDLQAANRLIKSLVRSEDLKMERINKRADELEKARKLSLQLETAIFEVETAIGIAGLGHAPVGERNIKELFDGLVNVRPILFRYASEAAENDEDALAEILSLNDNAFFEPEHIRRENGSGEECTDLLGAGEIVSRHEETQRERKEQQRRNEALPTQQALTPSSTSSGLEDVPFIGFVTPSPTPDLTRRAVPQPPNSLADLSSLLDRDLFLDASTSSVSSFKLPKPALKDLVNASSIPAGEVSLSPLDPFSESRTLSTFTSKSPPSSTIEDADSLDVNLFSSPARSLPTTIFFSIEQIQLSARPPLAVMDKSGIRVLLYASQNAPPGTQGVRAAAFVILNFNTYAISSVSFSACTATPMVSARLLKAKTNSLRAFSLMAPVDTISQVFFILPLSSAISEAEFDFSLTFCHMIEETISGSFIFRLQ